MASLDLSWFRGSQVVQAFSLLALYDGISDCSLGGFSVLVWGAVLSWFSG